MNPPAGPAPSLPAATDTPDAARQGTAGAEARRPYSMLGSPGLGEWLAQQQISLAFTTYQTNRLFLVGRNGQGGLAVNERLFDKPMGLFAQDDRLLMACRYQIWEFENRLAPGELHGHFDRLYVPSQSHTTGDLNVHDVVRDRHGRTLFVNTDFSCLAGLRDGYSFEPLWQPPFIRKLVAEDRCHLNGLALQDGEATWVTACGATDRPAGWRDLRTDGGVVLHIPSNDVAAGGLSMPHSPRWHLGRLWLLNAGTGELGYLDGARFQPVAFCPGFLRGLAFVGPWAVVGLSKLRSKSFGGLGLEQRLAAQGEASQCGLMVVEIASGRVVHTLRIDGVVEELFDVVVLPRVRRPGALGFQDDAIDRLVSYPGSGGLVTTRPTVQRPALDRPAPRPGLPRAAQDPDAHAPAIRYQRVFHLNPDNLRDYAPMTIPALQQRWQTQPQRGELLGVSASMDGQMVGFAVAECFTAGDSAAPQAELLSLCVSALPGADRIEAQLLTHLERFALQPLCR